jgi:hypothetical protein
MLYSSSGVALALARVVNYAPRVMLQMEQRALKNVNNFLNTNTYSYLETSGGQNCNIYINVSSFFQHQCQLDICGSLRQLYSCIGVQYALFHCGVTHQRL